MKKKCVQCNKSFSAARESAKFCSSNCRVLYSRDEKEVVVEEPEVTMKEKARLEKFSKIFEQLYTDRDKIASSFTGEAVFALGDNTVTIKGQKKKKK